MEFMQRINLDLQRSQMMRNHNISEKPKMKQRRSCQHVKTLKRSKDGRVWHKDRDDVLDNIKHLRIK